MSSSDDHGNDEVLSPATPLAVDTQAQLVGAVEAPISESPASVAVKSGKGLAGIAAVFTKKDTSSTMQVAAGFGRTLSDGADTVSDSYLDSVLRSEFLLGAQAAVDAVDDDLLESPRGEDDGAPPMERTKSLNSDRKSTVTSASAADPNDTENPTVWTANGLEKTEDHLDSRGPFRQACGRAVEHKIWITFFMSLTFFALFAPDIDMIYGNRESKVNMSIVTTFVAAAFLIEIVVQCLGKRGYVKGAYFWLDLVAFISLLPETYVVAMAFENNGAFVAGRSSRLTRMIRVATRSSRAARLNRLGRMVRVAALMPRIQRLWGHKVEDEDATRFLEKKLYRIFCFLDDDMDSYVTRATVMRCVRGLLSIAKLQQTGMQSKWRFKFTKTAALASSENGKGAAAAAAPDSTEVPMDGSAPASASSNAPGDTSDNAMTKITSLGSINNKSQDQLVGYTEFRSEILKDESLTTWLQKTCSKQLKKGNNMQAVRQRNSEYIGVKVALSILLIIFILSFVEVIVEDSSFTWGFETINWIVKKKYPNGPTEGEEIPGTVLRQVELWMKPQPELGRRNRRLFYLSVQKTGFCSELTADGQSCSLPNTSTMVWTAYKTLEAIDIDVKNSQYRQADLALLRFPEFMEQDVDLDAEQLEAKTEAVAILYDREAVENTARESIYSTIVVIVLILAGITLLTRDLSYLSKNLLKPLVELADEIESITRLQMAATNNDSQSEEKLESMSEIRLMRRSFDNMKKAIRSWGKYVPWPVVQLLMRKDAEASLEVSEKEVTIFFSDIASFTTIVESLPPEDSLLLLSRYFQEMSKIIDDFGGIVLEFIGDAIMCIYGTPVKNEDHPAAAVQASVKMLSSLVELNEWYERKQLPQVSIRCGVHTGKVLVGNMGFQSRMKYGIVGEDSNMPGRLEESNKNYGTEMLISHATWSRLDPNDFISRPIDIIHVQSEGSEQRSERIYEVTQRSLRKGKAQRQACTLQAVAMDLYSQGEFEQAAENFKKVGGLWSQVTGKKDEASAVMHKRCLSYMAKPPQDDWDGVWDRSNEG